jgi:competence ComEA-like helix-hairpin-helix protein
VRRPAKITKSEILLLAAALVFAALVIVLHLVRVSGPEQGRYTVTAGQTIPRPRAEDVLIDVNTADAETLQRLPGIGEALAERIVADREANAPFADLKDLTRVSGVGEKTVEAIAPYATAGGAQERR